MPVAEDATLNPVRPYGWSKLMTEVMLRDTQAAHGLGHVILRYFNVAGADPKMRTGQSTPEATHLIKVAVQTALGMRKGLDVFGTDYPTQDGTCIRDYIHVTDLARAHRAALNYLRAGGDSATLNCGYGRGYSVLQVIEAVKRSIGHAFPVRMAPRRPGQSGVDRCCRRTHPRAAAMEAGTRWPRHDRGPCHCLGTPAVEPKQVRRPRSPLRLTDFPAHR